MAVLFQVYFAGVLQAARSVSRPGVRLPGASSPAAAVRAVPAISSSLGGLAAPSLRTSLPGGTPSAFQPGLGPTVLPAPAIVEAGALMTAPAAVVLPASEEAAAAPGSLGRLEILGAELGGPDDYSAVLHHFENTAAPIPGGDFRDEPAKLPPPPAQPRRPRGARGVSVQVIRSAADVTRLIPAGPNSYQLISELRQAIPQMAPYYLYEYVDAFGGAFKGIDLSAKPGLIETYPDLQPHERSLIRKILAQNRDVQILVREDGKTPDLMVGGYVTELKSDMGTLDLDKIMSKANEQVHEHSRRHGLGPGGVAIDLVKYDKIPGAQVLAELNDFAHKAPRLALDRVFVFGRSDFKVFVRGPGKSYLADEDAGMGPGGTQRPLDPAEVHAVQLLAKKGRLGPAQSRLDELDRAAGPSTDRHSPINQARESVETQRMLLKVQKLSRRKQFHKAGKVWENFSKTHDPATVRQTAPKVKLILEPLPAPEKAPGPEAARFLKELIAPEHLLRSKGISATVTFYGSARILSPEEAARALEQAVSKHGRTPSTQEGREAVAAARAMVDSSKHYATARALAKLVAVNGKGRIAVVSGGGPGIMEAANRGAQDGGGPSVGYNIKLPNEQGVNRFVDPGFTFEFENFATRKMALRHGAAALTFFSGGFGTMDELFEILTLMQTGKMERVPIVLVGEKAYWSRVLDFEEFAAQGLISKGDLSLFKFAETAEEAWSVIESALKGR